MFQLDGLAVMAIVPHKSHLTLQLFNGSQLPDALGPLEGSGPGSRGLRCKLHQPMDDVRVEMLVSACVNLQRRQSAARPPRAERDPVA